MWQDKVKASIEAYEKKYGKWVSPHTEDEQEETDTAKGERIYEAIRERSMGTGYDRRQMGESY